MTLIDLAERGWLPDSLIRFGIRRLLRQRLKEVSCEDPGIVDQNLKAFAEKLRSSPLVIAAEDANLQHYEVPSEFFQIVLGKQLKYSSAYWPKGVQCLDEAEEAMLKLTASRAELQDGQRILELGCGWGSLTLWMSQHYPGSQITAVSNSYSQREYIERCCHERNLENVTVITCNIANLELTEKFDRVLSVEMFEHVRNHEQLLSRIADWMSPESKLFVHLFCHKDSPYLFEVQSSDDWMTKHFFEGGMMPAKGLLGEFNQHLKIDWQWYVNGSHYAQTCEAWLRNLDQQIDTVREIFRRSDLPEMQCQRWRMFFMACAELFAFRQGTEWGVAHYLLSPVPAKSFIEAPVSV